jgi:hypothetical protein
LRMGCTSTKHISRLEVESIQQKTGKNISERDIQHW